MKNISDIFTQNVTLDSDCIVEINGKPLDDKLVARLTGAPDSSVIKITKSQSEFKFEITNEKYFDQPYVRKFDFENISETVLINEDLYVKEAKQGEGLGAHIFAFQAFTAHALGIKRIAIFAATGIEGDKVYNGLKTWTKFGFTAQLPHSWNEAQRFLKFFSTSEDLTKKQQADWYKDWPECSREAKFVHDLTPNGIDWFIRCPVGIDMDFDLNPQSYSWKKYMAYLSSKEISTEIFEVN